MVKISNYESLKTAAYNFLFHAEEHIVTVYSDSKGIPTIAVGVALAVKGISGKFELIKDFKDLFDNMGAGFDGTPLENIKADVEKTIKYLNGEGGANMFKSPSELKNSQTLQEEIAKYGSIDQNTFKNVTWENYLFNKHLTELENSLGFDNLNALSVREQTALYSLNYNARTLIGNGMKSAINLYVNGENEDQKFIGKMEAWREILYLSNSGNDKGLQNRRFYEANEFLGVENNTKPEIGVTEVKSIFPVETLHESLLFFSFINSPRTQTYSAGTYTQPMYWHMYRKFYDIPGYKHIDYHFAQDHCRAAFEKIFAEQGIIDMRKVDHIPDNQYAPEYKLENLFRSFMLYTDLKISKDGTTEFFTPNFKSQNEMFFSLREYAENRSLTLNLKEGDDYADTTSYAAGNTLFVNMGAGYDTYVGGEADDWVNGGLGVENAFTRNHIDLGGGENLYWGSAGIDTVGTKGNAFNTNRVYLGSGNDTFYGGNANDIVDSGSGATPDEATKALLNIDLVEWRDTTDYVGNLNKVFLGGGSDTFIGGQGNDIVFGGASDPNSVIYDTHGKAKDWVNEDNGGAINTISLGAGNDEYYSSGGTNIVSSVGANSGDDKYIYFKNGNNTYTCDKGLDTVKCEGGVNHITNASGGDVIYFNGGINTLEGDAQVHLNGGNNTLIFNNSGAIYGVNENDTISFKDLGLASFVCFRNGKDVEVSINQHERNLRFVDVLDKDGNLKIKLPKINGYDLPTPVGGRSVGLEQADLLIQSMSTFGASYAGVTDLSSSLSENNHENCNISCGNDIIKKIL